MLVSLVGILEPWREDVEMSDSQTDIWCQWLLDRRFGGDPKRMKMVFDVLYPIRDRVLSHIDLGENEVLLDVGCGDGLIAFAALEQFKQCRVIFSDISQDLLRHVENLAQEMKVHERCQFHCVSADDLSRFDSESVHAVTTRSVLIYVAAKQKAFNEFYRILKAGGCLSIFEPINRFGFPEPPHQLGGYDVTPVADLAQRLDALYQRIQPIDSDPMVDFDERDLLSQAENAGFSEVHLDLQVEVKPHQKEDWMAFFHVAMNPKIPTLEEATRELFTPDETERFVNHLRPLVEAGKGMRRRALAYLWAVK
jgi:ubiquinone/menaquinone biosynthesis C-methylase UbiE